MTPRPAHKRKPPPADLVEVFDEVEQRSPEWDALRCGVPTASRFGTMMASGKDGGESVSRARLLYQMAGEVLSGVPAETYVSRAMERGIRMEPAALEHYAFTRGVEVARVGFIRRTIPNQFGGALVVGCSPDGLVGDDGGVQVKTMQPDLLVELVDRGRFPSEHRAQCQGEMWVTGRRWWDLKIFYEGLPLSPVFRLERDEAYIAQVAAAVETFAFDLRRLVERVKAKGGVR